MNKEDIRKNRKNFNWIKIKTYQSLRNAAEAGFWGEIVANAYIRKQESSQINYLSFYHKKLEKEWKTKPKVSRGKKIIKSRNQWYWKQKTCTKTMKPKTITRRKVNEIDKPLVRLTRKRKKTLNTNTWNEKGT